MGDNKVIKKLGEEKSSPIFFLRPYISSPLLTPLTQNVPGVLQLRESGLLKDSDFKISIPNVYNWEDIPPVSREKTEALAKAWNLQNQFFYTNGIDNGGSILYFRKFQLGSIHSVGELDYGEGYSWHGHDKYLAIARSIRYYGQSLFQELIFRYFLSLPPEETNPLFAYLTMRAYDLLLKSADIFKEELIRRYEPEDHEALYFKAIVNATGSYIRHNHYSLTRREKRESNRRHILMKTSISGEEQEEFFKDKPANSVHTKGSKASLLNGSISDISTTTMSTRVIPNDEDDGWRDSLYDIEDD